MSLEFYEALKAHAKNTPDKAAIIDGETSMSYGELLQKAEKFAGALDSLDPGPKSKIAILSVNQKEFIIALLGSFLKGLPVIPINFLLGPEDLVHIVREAEIDTLLVDKFFVIPGSEQFFKLFKNKIAVGAVDNPELLGEGSLGFDEFVAAFLEGVGAGFIAPGAAVEVVFQLVGVHGVQNNGCGYVGDGAVVEGWAQNS